MSATFMTPTLPHRTHPHHHVPRRPRSIPKAVTPPPQPPRISRRTLLLSLLPLPALARSSFPDIDPGTSLQDSQRAESADSLLHSRKERYGITDHTHATHEDYLRVLHVDNPPHALHTALARASVIAFVAAFSAFGMAVSERESLRNPLPRVYDKEAVDRYFRIRPDKVVRRMALFAREITGLGTRWAIDAALALVDSLSVKNGVRGLEWMNARNEARAKRRATLLREVITRLGTAVIKLGQAAASRQDLLGVGVIRELQKLQDDILDYFPTVEAFAVVEDELGATPQKLFQDISPVPVAGASLGMVFKARVDDTIVAVKVQRPEVAENIALDCYIVRWMASLATVVLRSRTNLTNAVDEYASRLYEELDYLNELDNMDKFRQLYGDMEGIYLPRAFPDYCSRRVLVTEWVDGVKLIDDDAKVRPEDIGLVKTGIRFALTQLLDKGFLHADMHNGNMMRTKSGYLAFIDFGLVSYVPVSVRESLVCALLQLFHGEYAQLAQSFSGLAIMNADDLEVDLPLLSEALRSKLEPTDGGTNFSLIGIVGKLLSLGTEFRFVFNDYFLNNLRCLGMLEGLALAADPQFSVMQVVYPYVADKLLSEKSARYERTLSGLVLDSYGRIRWNRMERIVANASDYPADEAMVRYMSSTKGSFLRKYVSEECVSKMLPSWRRTDTTTRGEITRREEGDDETLTRARGLLFSGGLRRLLLAGILAISLIPALLERSWRMLYDGLTSVSGSRKPTQGEVVTEQWRAFDSRFQRRCGKVM